MTTTLKKIDGVWHAPVNAAGKKKWVSTGETHKPEAQRVLDASGVEKLNTAAKAGRLTQKAIGQILTGKHLTCEKAVDEYHRHMQVTSSNITAHCNLVSLSAWLRKMKLSTTPPSAVTEDQIDRFINNAKWKAGARTRQNYLDSIRGFFAFCSAKGYVAADPAKLVGVDHTKLTHDQKESHGNQPWTEAEINRMIVELSGEWAKAKERERLNQPHPKRDVLFADPYTTLFWLVAISVAKETGLRLRDIAKLEWTQFQTEGKLISHTNKTNKRVELPITSALQDLISEVPVTDATYIFPEQKAITEDPQKRASVSTQFRRLCERLGLKSEGKTFHSTRHFKATTEFNQVDKDTLAKKLAESLTVDQIRQLLGHSNQSTTKRYLHKEK